MNAREPDSVVHGVDSNGTAGRISTDKPTYPVVRRPANPHAPPRARQDPSQE